jgi:hypothetical protein
MVSTRSHACITRERRVDRYYDPSTDQFLSVDPDVAETGQPYAFTGDDPLNETDPLGLSGNPVDVVCSGGGRVPRGESRNAYCNILRKRAKVVTKMECRNGGDCGNYTCGRYAIGCWYPLGVAAGVLLCVAACPAAAGAASDAAGAAARQAAESGLRKVVNACLLAWALCVGPSNTLSNTPVEDTPDPEIVQIAPEFPDTTENPYKGPN